MHESTKNKLLYECIYFAGKQGSKNFTLESIKNKWIQKGYKMHEVSEVIKKAENILMVQFSL